MTEDRLIQSLQRLACAVNRIEEATAAFPPGADGVEVDRLRARVDQLVAHEATAAARLEQLTQRHERLRASAAEAAARLGELIG